MTDKYNIKDDILLFLREKHTGAENYVSSAGLEITEYERAERMRRVQERIYEEDED